MFLNGLATFDWNAGVNTTTGNANPQGIVLHNITSSQLQSMIGVYKTSNPGPNGGIVADRLRPLAATFRPQPDEADEDRGKGRAADQRAGFGHPEHDQLPAWVQHEPWNGREQHQQRDLRTNRDGIPGHFGTVDPGGRIIEFQARITF
jgi:hypothetical protein